MNPLATMANPFQTTVVQDAWQAPPVDVASIHEEAFAQILKALDSVSRGKPDSLLVYGGAGAGKTHLLSRLQRHLVATAPEAPDRVLRCVFVSVKLQTNAQMLWQFLRRRLATDLLRKQEGVTQLQRLVAHQLAGARKESPRQWVRALRVLTTTDDPVSEHLAEVAQRLELAHDLHAVLEHLVHNRFPMDAAAWLRGDSLPESALGRLGLAPQEEADREEAARRVVTDLCRLAGETLPIVFCFDQIEAIQVHPEDRDALFRFGRVAADLAEADDNVLLLSCIQSAFLDLLATSLRESDRDRIFRRRAVLEPLVPAEVEALLRSRLDSIEGLQALRAAAPDRPLYPFDASLVADLAGMKPCVPRKVLARASARFEELQSGRASPQRAPERFLALEYEGRRAMAMSHGGSGDSRSTLTHGLPMLWSLGEEGTAGSGAGSAAKQLPSGVDLGLASRSGGWLEVAICHETNMTSLAAHLRQIVSQPAGGARKVLVRDARLAISRTAKKTQEYLGALDQRGVRLVQPDAEALAALEALRSLLSDARAGDLADVGDGVSEGAVAAWLAKHLDPALAELVEELAGDEPATPPVVTDQKLVRDLGDLMLRACVARLDDVATELGQPTEVVLAVARDHANAFGVLHGPPAVLFAYVPAETLARVDD